MRNPWQTSAGGHSTWPTHSYGQPFDPYAGQPYPYAGAAYGGPFPETSGRATAILVLGICSLVLLTSCIGIIPAIIALCLAPGATREIEESGGTVAGTGLVQAGKTMSWVTVALTVLVLVLIGVVLLVSAAGAAVSTP